MDKFGESLFYVLMEEVMKSWYMDYKYWNVVLSLVNLYSIYKVFVIDMDLVKNCRYIREGRLMKKKFFNWMRFGGKVIN